jgi:membrane protein insertase Oxa1/YidC/SpoIIIJ
MGRTVPSFRIVAEWEKSKWKPFRQQLDKSERKMFDEMMSYPQLYNVAGVGACKPVLIQPILMSIIFEHYKQLRKLSEQEFKTKHKSN